REREDSEQQQSGLHVSSPLIRKERERSVRAAPAAACERRGEHKRDGKNEDDRPEQRHTCLLPQAFPAKRKMKEPSSRRFDGSRFAIGVSPAARRWTKTSC